MYITRDGVEINMNDLIKNVNFNHLELPEAAFRSYENIHHIYMNSKYQEMIKKYLQEKNLKN